MIGFTNWGNKESNKVEILNQTGNTNWEDVVSWFGSMTTEQIEAECDRVWPHEDHSEFAEFVYDTINR